MMMANHRRNESGKACGPILPDAETLAKALQLAEPGITLSREMCTLRETFTQLIRDTRDLGETLADYLRDEDASEGNGSSLGRAQQEEGGMRFPAGTPGYLRVTWVELVHRQEQIMLSLTTSYSVQYRDTLLQMLMSAFGPKSGEPSSTKALEGILTAVHDELTCIARNLKLSSGDTSLADMVDASWRGAMSTLKLLALNQAHFRPLQPDEADWAREFMMSLKRMYDEEVPLVMAQKLRRDEQDLAKGHPSGSALRSINYGYCSSLLQALTADSEDLRSMYKAQSTCLQQAELHAGSVFIELGPSQISLLDILRILRQRRQDEDFTKAFVSEELERAEAVATQIVFGLSSQERVVAEFRCFVITDGEQSAAVAAAEASSKPTSLSGPGKTIHRQSARPPERVSHLTKLTRSSLNTGHENGAASISTSVNGRLYLTQSCICYTTMFDGDLKRTSDTTLILLRTQVHPSMCSALVNGVPANCVVLTTIDRERYTFAGFSAGDSTRLLGLLSNESQMGGGSASPASKPGSVNPSPHQNEDDHLTGSVEGPPASAWDAGFGDAGSPPVRPLGDRGTVVMSVPCYLYGTLVNTDGVLQVYKDRLDFVKEDQVVWEIALDRIELIGQRPLPLLQSGTGSLMTVQVTGVKKRTLEFGGITDALIASLKQAISDLCFDA